MIDQFRILHQTPQNYVAWSHRQPPCMPTNPAVFSRLPNYLGRVKWNVSKPKRRNIYHRGEHARLGRSFENANVSSEAKRLTRKFHRFHYPKRRFTKVGHLSAPFAPRNTTSFRIRAKKFGCITSLVSPYAVTPAILMTSMLSPSTEVVVEMAKEMWGVDGDGTMKGLIRLRSGKENSCDNNGGEVCEFEKRLNNDLSRFEMIYPSFGEEHSLENRVDEQDLQIAHLKEHNLSLKERIFIMERELGDLRRCVVCLETEGIGVVDRDSENFNDGEFCSKKSIENGVLDDGESDDN